MNQPQIRTFNSATVSANGAGFASGLMGPRNFATPSTPVVGTPFWHAVS